MEETDDKTAEDRSGLSRCRAMGEAGAAKAAKLYAREEIFRRLRELYERATENCRKRG